MKEAARGTVAAIRHQSEVLRGNAPRDPTERDVWIYLPPGYGNEGSHYPVVYCLTGFTGRGKGLLNDNAFTPNLAERMDKLIAARTIEPMIVVMPDCFTYYGGSQYINSTATGRYEDYLTLEIVPFIDSELKTISDRLSRAVMGKSSGGYGALVMAMRHADTFGLACSTAGDAYFEYCYLQDFAKAFRTIKGDPAAFMENFWSTERKGRDFHPALNTIGMSACYSPNGNEFDLPFDLLTGEIRQDVWERWLSHDPVRMAENCLDNLNSLKLLFIDAGTRDEYSLDVGARIFSKKLRDLGVAHIHEEFDDGHGGIAYRYDRSLELISENIQR